MNHKTYINKKEVLVLFVCIAFLLMTFDAVGRMGGLRSKSVLCRAHLQQWSVIFNLFYDDNDGKTIGHEIKHFQVSYHLFGNRKHCY